MSTNINNQHNHLDYQMYVPLEQDEKHQPYQNEYDFYAAVQEGNLSYIDALKKQYPATENSGKGRLSADPVRNERYHFIVNASTITRVCIEGGMPQEEAYNMSDMYIRQADKLHTIASLRSLNDEMVLYFATYMEKLHCANKVCHHIQKCIHYIHENLHTKITLQDLSRVTGLHESYLATLFKKETGESIHRYIRAKRLETARSMLLHSSYSSTEIANMLAFSSQSHFIQSFREYYGTTPYQYRNRHWYGKEH